jgi:hypothetical protein
MAGPPGGSMSEEPGTAVPIDGPEQINLEAQHKAIELRDELRQRREILSADMLAGLVAPRARLEQSYTNLSAYFFTVDGVLNGRKISGALFAGECMLIFAPTEAAAQDLANRGLRSTIELMEQEFNDRVKRGEVSPVEEGLQHESAGRHDLNPGSTINTPQMQKLKAIMATEIGKLPWKW